MAGRIMNPNFRFSSHPASVDDGWDTWEKLGSIKRIETTEYVGIMNQFSLFWVPYGVSKLAALAQTLITLGSPSA
jgi:hypothetical protein